ncbi:MAG TPA: hypothetical protein VKS81_07625 [Bacteroidota bacterium]|nr:hypothetical protein [Bacteroidota bacterium]
MSPIKVELHGNEYTLRFPNLARVKQVQNILSVDIIADAKKIDSDFWYLTRNLETQEQTADLLKAIIAEPVGPEVLETITEVEIIALLNAFFLRAMRFALNLTGDLQAFSDTLRAATTSPPPAASGSISPSSAPAKES